MNRLNNLSLEESIALYALAAVDKTKSAKEKAEEAFAIAQELVVLYDKNKKAPGAARLAH